ncbi:MAG: hypothetical protein HYU78_10845 [Rhodocyclales bacterium]|nr:hypothetical protein [Rhodocyclales bacterium]
MTAMLATLRQLKECHQRLAAQTEVLNWEGVLSEWQNADKLFADLRSETVESLPAEQKEEARILMEEVLATEQAMVARIKPWMEQVRPMLESFAHNRISLPKDSAT